MIVRRLTCPACGRTWTVLVGDQNVACPGCGSAGEPAETEPVQNAQPTDGERLLIALRARGATGIHSHEIRKLGISGNPSQRITELERQGHEIHHKSEHKGRRPGVRYRLAGASIENGEGTAGHDHGAGTLDRPAASPFCADIPGAPSSVDAGPGDPSPPEVSGSEAMAKVGSPAGVSSPAASGSDRLPGLEPSPYEQLQDRAA